MSQYACHRLYDSFHPGASFFVLQRGLFWSWQVVLCFAVAFSQHHSLVLAGRTRERDQ